MTLLPQLAGVVAGLVLAAALGWALSRRLPDRLGRFEKLAWSFGAGLLLQAVLFLGVVTVFPGRVLPALLVLDAAVIAVGVSIRRRPRPPLRVESARAGSAGPSTVALLGVAGAAWLISLVVAISEPMWSTDYLAIWGLKGRTIAATGRIPERLFEDPALDWAHREYPLLVPISLASLASIAGGWDDRALALFFPACGLATLAVVHGFLSRSVSPVAGATGAALAALCFPLFRSDRVGTAEIPFAFSLVLVSTAFLDALADRPASRALLLRLAVAALVCVSVKQEGTMFVLLVVIALAARRLWSAAAVLGSSAALHGLLLLLLRGPQTRRDFDFGFFVPSKWPDLASRFFPVVGHVLKSEALAAWIPLAAVVLYFLVTRRGVADSLLPVLGLQMVGYAVAFSASAFDPTWAAGVFGRLALTLFPSFALALAARIPSNRVADSRTSGPADRLPRLAFPRRRSP